MISYIPILLTIGLAALSMAWMPLITKKTGISYSIVFVLAGMALFSSLEPFLPLPNPLRDLEATHRLTELVVIISLMGSGLRIDEPFRFKDWRIPFRLISLTMLLSILIVTIIGHFALNLTLPCSLLLGSVLAPTDPVLASDVQVGPPNDHDRNPAKFNLTVEAGMNDGSAFPFVWLAILFNRTYPELPEMDQWFAFYLVAKIAIGITTGWLLGKGLGWLLFTLPKGRPHWKTTDGLISLAATLVVYSATELLYGYGFIAVFVAAVTLRNQELNHQLHETLHDFIDQIERILVAIVLLLLGGSIVEHILKSLNWRDVLFCLFFVLLIRPLTTLIALVGTDLTKPQKTAISFFGIKGIGSFYYLAFALSVEQFKNPDVLWSITASVVLFSIVIHGLTANKIMQNIK